MLFFLRKVFFFLGENVFFPEFAKNVFQNAIYSSSNGLLSTEWVDYVSSGSRISRWGGRQPPTRTLFGENVCENERNLSCWGGAGDAPLDPPMYVEEPVKYQAFMHHFFSMGFQRSLAKLLLGHDKGTLGHRTFSNDP